MRSWALLVGLLAALSGCQLPAPTPLASAPAPEAGNLDLFRARLKLALAMTRSVQTLPDFWDQASVTVSSGRLKAAATTTLSTSASALSPSFSLPIGPATVSIEVRAQGIVMATGSAPVSLAAGLNTVTVTMSPWTNQVVTMAGGSTSGYVDGVGAVARFNGPRGLTLDGAGNVIVADASNHRIRQITPQGSVTTIAGSGTASYADGTGTGASFNAPSGVARDTAGNLYVADTQNHRIRKISTGGAVTTLAGNGSVGATNHTNATLASFNQPWGIAVNNVGDVFVADFGNNLIRRISTGGQVTTFASTGLSGPSGLALDSVGNLIVANYSDSRVLKISTGGTVTTLGGTGVAGFSGDGSAAGSAQFNQPRAVCVDSSDNVYVADTFNYRVRRILAGTNVVSTLVGNGTSNFQDGAAGTAQFGALFGIVARGTGDRLYLADFGAQRVRMYVAP